MELSLEIFQKIAHIKNNNKKIVAVGTTATRTLESLPYLWKKLDIKCISQFDAKTRNYWNNITTPIKDGNFIQNPTII